MNLFLGSDRRPVHFIGIAGAGMSALATVALRRGVVVSGSDRAPEGAPDLPGQGAMVVAGADPDLVDAARAVVVSAAIPSDHPELMRARARGIPVVPRKEALALLVEGANVVAVAGTHGKTTTTVMATEALAAAGLDPTGLAGGRVAGWGGNARIGSDRLFVVEADEYDQAFLALHPSVAVVTNVEPEHLECYQGSAERQEEAFVEFAGRAGTVVLGPGPGAAAVAARLRNRVWTYGGATGDLPLREVTEDRAGSRGMVDLPDGTTVELRLAVPGRHNLLNAVAVLGVVAALEAPVEPALSALARFQGVGRRFERKGEVAGVAVVDDYAHHPTEIEATLQAARQAFPGRRIVAVFQPHLYSRTERLAGEMGRALATGGAGLVFVTEVYPAREAPIPGVSGRLVVEAARSAAGGAEVRFAPDADGLVQEVVDALVPGDVVLTIGAGDVTAVGPALLERLGEIASLRSQ